MKLFVRNFPYSWNDCDLLEIFKPYGATSARVMTDRQTGRSKGFGQVDIPDSTLAKRAVSQKNNCLIGKFKLQVKVDENQREAPPQDDFASPYRFVARKKFTPAKPPSHGVLLEKRYDIAFDVTWKLLSPTAHNPCTAADVSSKCPESNEDHYLDYDKRWLLIDNCLAISPFTVKSAIANGFANLLGSCYRVNTEVVEHQPIEKGQYPYTGCWKRGRVSMSGTSKPGILKEKIEVKGGWRMVIQPATEYYYNSPTLPLKLNGVTGFNSGYRDGDRVAGAINYRQNANGSLNCYKPPDIIELDVAGKTLSTGHKQLELYYFGPYFDGMDAKGNHNKHFYRFYRPEGKTLEGVLPQVNFKSLEELKKRVYMGQFKDDKEKQWYEHLDTLKPGDWVYYQIFDGAVAHVGKCFLFKALFCHEDTVPDGQQACDQKEQLCPRCAMFGMTESEETADKSRDAVGYGSRFKASPLISSRRKLTEGWSSDKYRVPFEADQGNYRKISLKEWTDGSKPVCRQVLLPIQATPKNNKREGRYYDQKTGKIAGAKEVLHGSKGVANLQELQQLMAQCDQKIERKNGEFIYAHQLRRYAMVCEEGEEFHGTLGAESCTPEEIAALIMLLDYRVAKHGFKIGKGKTFGLGSVASCISTVWVRDPREWKWTPFSFAGTIDEKLAEQVPGVSEVLESLLKVQTALNTIEGMTERRLGFVKAGLNYWRDFAKHSAIADHVI